ncbi:MAG: amidohydrolase family protein [Actinomycetota bacterium]
MGWFGPGILVDDPAVVIQGSRISYAGRAFGANEGDREITGDWFLMPGVVDRHVHIGLSDPRLVVRGGVTVVRDLGWPAQDIFALADISAGTDFDGPEIGAAGPIITARRGYPSRAGWAPEGTALEVRGAKAAAAAAARLADEDAVAIKIALASDAGPTLSDQELVAVCQAAHDRGLPVVAHVQGRGQTERAVGAGVDELAHCPWSERIGERLVRGMAERVRMVSTLDIHAHAPRTRALDIALDNLRRFVKAGGRVAYGTDLGNGPIPPGIHVGEATLLASAGLSPDRILDAMTAWRLEEGARADVIGLEGNPLEDLSALDRVRVVIRGGQIRHLVG